ncbi:MAG: dihydroorotase [Candidatus Paceibacterota bacterium]
MFSIEGIIANIGMRSRIEIDQATGLISKVGTVTGAADIVLKDELIFPGFIDLHVHAREDMSHTQDYKEDFSSAEKAAINGGVVAFAEMPNNPIPPIDEKSYETKKELTKKSIVPVVLYAGIGPKTKPLATNVPYKVFMGKSVGDLFFTSLNELESVIKNYEGQYVSFHSEDPEILEKSKNETTHESQRPPRAEIVGIDFALQLIEKYNLFGKICHVSTIEGMNRIIEAKKRGINVTVEVTPHHLYFSKANKMLQVNPPIRTEENCVALIKFLKNGDIDYLATDHAPHTREEKEKGISGMPHLDTYGPFATWLMQEQGFSPEEIARVCSKNPANFFNHFTESKYGEIKEGCMGSLTIIDMNKPITVTKEILKTKCAWSPFEGTTFPGSVAITIIKGKVYDKR